MLTVNTINVDCKFCGSHHEIELDLKDLKAWQAGQKIQVVMPYLDADQRELLISNTCTKCWEDIFPEE
jgi:hypothetical protein